ncbi:uncharacterized protein (DUF736 family) [Bradyrhizobium sp. i1.8.4]
MATIGTFKKTGNNEFNGEIVTLSLQARNVRIIPETSRSGDSAPSHRIYVGRVEIGAAWSKRSNEGRDYLGLKLDDPSFTAPIFANLFADEEGEGFSLIWSRPSRRNGDIFAVKSISIFFDSAKRFRAVGMSFDAIDEKAPLSFDRAGASRSMLAPRRSPREDASESRLLA